MFSLIFPANTEKGLPGGEKYGGETNTTDQHTASRGWRCGDWGETGDTEIVVGLEDREGHASQRQAVRL